MATVADTSESIVSPASTKSLNFPPHRLTVDRYERMVESGIFGAKEPIFLWHGKLVEKTSKGEFHAYAVVSLIHLFVRLVPEGWHSRPEQPVRIGDDSMPEPDLTVIRGTMQDYRQRAPTAEDVALVVEVADSSLAIDSGDVLLTYASQGLPVYWIVNIPKRRIEVYREPTGPSEGCTRGFLGCLNCRSGVRGVRPPIPLELGRFREGMRSDGRLSPSEPPNTTRKIGYTPSERPGYQNCRHFVPGERVPVVLDGREVGTVDVAEILP